MKVALLQHKEKINGFFLNFKKSMKKFQFMKEDIYLQRKEVMEAFTIFKVQMKDNFIKMMKNIMTHHKIEKVGELLLKQKAN